MFTYRVDDEIELRLLEEHKAPAIFALIDRNRAHLRQHLHFVDRTRTVDDALAYIRRMRKAFGEGTVAVSVYYHGELVGDMGLTKRGHGKAEIGYWLDEAYVGKGIVTRAVRALLDYGFGQLGLKRVIIRCGTDNPRSYAIPERLGFTFEGIAREDGWLNDRYVDLRVYSMLMHEWQATRPERAFEFRLDEHTEIRLLEERYAEAVFATTDANRAHLREWMPWLDGTQSSEDSRAFIRGALTQYAENNGFQCGIWHEGRYVGAISYHYWNFAWRKTEIGYWLAKDVNGRGIITRATQALIHYAFAELGLNRIELACAVGNSRSCAIPKRLGFTYEGIARQAEWLYDHYVDWNVFSLLADDWRKGTV